MGAMTPSDVKVGPVGWFSRRTALRMIGRGHRTRPGRAHGALARLYRSRRRADGALFWQACRQGRGVAAAMVVPNPGRFGMLLYSPPGSDDVDVSALSTLLGRISAEACRRGLAFVQSLVHPAARADAAALESAGMIKLAELVYMRLDLLVPGASAGPGVGAKDAADQAEWAWRPYERFSESELGRAIAETYAGSLDCPLLVGVRQMSDVLAGHRASGTFRPSAWWLVERDGAPAGCILVNASAVPRVAEVVYVGVSPAFRGCRLGRTMLLRAVRQAGTRKDRAITLAVDSRNTYALRMYASVGFRRVFSRLAYISGPSHRLQTGRCRGNVNNL